MNDSVLVKREPVNRSVRALAVLGSAVTLLLLSTPAWAVSGRFCSTLNCTANPSVTVGSGGLHNAEIVPILWGTAWTAAQQAQLAGIIQQMVNGPYLGALAQYGGDGVTVGPARMVPTVPIRAVPVPGATCSINHNACFNYKDCPKGQSCGLNEVVSAINATISAGIVPPPPATNQAADVLYVVIAPTTFTGFAANDSGSWNNRPYKLAWIPGIIDKGIAHEVVEAITQNVTVANCTDADGNSAGQIVDLCCNFTTQGGLSLPGYWSSSDQQCVAPEGWQGVYRYENSPGSWTQISSATVRQVYAGGYGVVATDTSDNLQLYAPGSNTWTTISTPGSMFAVGTGTNTIVRLSQVADAVAVYNGSPNSWTTIHGARSAVYAGSRIVTTDFLGTEFSWSGNGDNWTNIGKAGDQIVVTGTGRVYGIALDHSAVWMTPDNSGVWSQVGAASSQLFGGLGQNPAGNPLQPIATRDIWMYQGTGQTWLRQNGPGTMFAEAGPNGDLFMLDRSRSTIQESTNTHQTNPTWTTIRTSGLGRLVGSGTQLYAVGVPAF
jgi:hypothetical protein